MPRHPNYGANPECSIKGCVRHVYRGYLCRPHWSIIPHETKMRWTMDSYHQQIKLGHRHRRRALAEARRLIKEGAAI